MTKQTGILPYDKLRPRDELTQLVIGVGGRMVIKMNRRIKLLSAFMAGAILFTGTLSVTAAAAKASFIHVSGSKILDENENEFLIKGIAFGNSVWSEPKTPNPNHHTANSYKEIAEFGFNSVRFYLNYNLFEDDSKPYEYKESGFDWLDINIKWAKKYGIKLILNMHVPQGGFQSQGNGTALWTNKENQKRLKALWTEIAKRYSNEPVIIGYGLINEPIIPFVNTIDESLGAYNTYIRSLVKAIRTVDKNHIIFVESVLAVKNLETGKSTYGGAGGFTHNILSDKNIVYEFHNYSPHSFTHQDTDWAGTKDVIKYYPVDEISSFESDYAWIGCQNAVKTNKTNGDWVYYESSAVVKTDKYNMGKISCQVNSCGEAGIAYFDKVKVTEYNSKGKVTNTFEMEPSRSAEYYYWSSNGTGSFGKSDYLYLKGSTSDANFSGVSFELREGYKYVVSGWVKRESCNSWAVTIPRIDYMQGTNIQRMDKSYLMSTLKPYIDFGKKNNVPMYLGEFGVVNKAFINDRGAEAWVKDMITLCKKYKLHFNYHTFHEVSFGLYMNGDFEKPDNLNQKLAKLFVKILK